MSEAADLALSQAYDETARCCGELVAARLFFESNPSISLQAMVSASQRLASAINLILLASKEAQHEIAARVAAVNGEPARERSDA